MKIAIFGTGYVGLVTGVCLANVGVDVVCVDIDGEKILELNTGGCPIHEKDLPSRLREGVESGRLSFMADAQRALRDADVAFITVGTPPGENGEADLSAVFAVAKTIGQYAENEIVVVQKSTVPVGTGKKIEEIISAELSNRLLDFRFKVVSNPEFLKEGDAIKDFESPARVVIGTDDQWAADLVSKLYQPFMRKGNRIIVMGRESAELTKYCANSMLAVRISFMNFVSQLAEEVGADVKDIRLGMGTDPRIGPDFLYPGVGFGGSCFPKDLHALMETCKKHGIDTSMLDSVVGINTGQRTWFCEKISKRFPDFSGMKFAVWGLAFKGGTDDVREAASLEVIDFILKNGGAVVAFDPHAIEEFQKNFGDRDGLSYSESQYDVLVGCDCLVILTDERAFRNPDLKKVLKALKEGVIFDGRNLYEPDECKKLGIEYHCVGRTQ